MPSPDRPPTLADVLRRATERLARAGVPDPAGRRRAARRRTSSVPVEVESRPRSCAATCSMTASAAALDALVARRATREPLQHITGLAPFRHLELACRTRRVRAAARDRDGGAARDRRAAGRGIPVARSPSISAPAAARSPSRSRPRCRMPASSPPRTRSRRSSGRRRTSRTGADNATLAFIDLEHAFPELDGTVSVVVSNPPYVPDAAIPRDPEVRLFDPPAALYGGEDGLDVVRVAERRRPAPRPPGRHRS